MGYDLVGSDYLEQTIKRLVEELKAKNCLSQDFQFLTKAERKQAVEDFVYDFIKTEGSLDHH